LDKFSWLSDQGCRVLIDHLQDGIFAIEAGVFVYVNPGLAKMLGYPVNELIGRAFIDFIAANDQALVWERHRARLSGESVPDQYEITLKNADGSLIFCSISTSLSENPQGHTVAIGSVRDVSQQKAELAALEASKGELKSIFDELPDVFYRTDMQGIITMISPSCYDIIAYRQEEMLGTPMSDYYESPEDRQKIVQAITDGGGKATKVEAGLRHKNGSIVWISTNAFVRYDSNRQPVSVDGVARDISERKRMEDQLTELSRIDGLTGVYSRRHFWDKSEAVIDVMRRYQRPASMMMLDLDLFKNINDTYGHHVGDLALIAFIKACRQEIRESDVLGRLGGEEFALMLPETPIQNAQVLAERIRAATAAIEIPAGSHRVSFTVSIGVVELNAGDQSLDCVMDRADRAMYQAKQRGRNQVITSFDIV
jgi:diguanylate cyclase (GGDEF)-like protein/PAS domain S-box-containing protein